MTCTATVTTASTVCCFFCPNHFCNCAICMIGVYRFLVPIGLLFAPLESAGESASLSDDPPFLRRQASERKMRTGWTKSKTNIAEIQSVKKCIHSPYQPLAEASTHNCHYSIQFTTNQLDHHWHYYHQHWSATATTPTSHHHSPPHPTTQTTIDIIMNQPPPSHLHKPINITASAAIIAATSPTPHHRRRHIPPHLPPPTPAAAPPHPTTPTPTNTRHRTITSTNTDDYHRICRRLHRLRQTRNRRKRHL